MKKPFADWKLRWADIRRRIYRFSGLLSFCGVAVVLVTFIIKDVLRDQEGKFVGALETAESAYNSQRVKDDILKKLDSILANFWAQETDVQKEFVKVTSLDDKLSELSTRWRRLQLLLETFPERRRELAVQFANQANEVQLTRVKFVSIPLEDLNQRAAAFDKWIGSTAHLSSWLSATEAKVIGNFERERRHAREKLERFTLFSYFLYPFGIFIGVLGQLAGVKSAGAE